MPLDFCPCGRNCYVGPILTAGSEAADALRSTTELAAWLLSLLDQHDPLKRVLAVRDDFLGVYQYEIPSNLVADEFAVNRATIRLYWGVIGLVAEWIGCTVEDLAIVVLTHELAHAYSQLGADIEGRRWQATVFSQAERGLSKGGIGPVLYRAGLTASGASLWKRAKGL